MYYYFFLVNVIVVSELSWNTNYSYFTRKQVNQTLAPVSAHTLPSSGDGKKRQVAFGPPGREVLSRSPVILFVWLFFCFFKAKT